MTRHKNNVPRQENLFCRETRTSGNRRTRHALHLAYSTERRGGARRGQMAPKETTPLTPAHLEKTEQSYAARGQSGSSSETSQWWREAQARVIPRVHPVTARTSRVPTARRTLRRFRVTRHPNRPDTPLALDSKGSPGAILRGTCPLYATFE